MPIRVQCKCSKSLSVPDAMAGKSGKCPACGEILRIPAAGQSASSATAPTTNIPTKPKSAPARPASAPVSAPPQRKVAAQSPTAKANTNKGALDQLFSDAGFNKPRGPECPSCQAPITAATVICVKCGYNIATGQKIQGLAFEDSADPVQGVNRQLRDAKASIQKEFETDEAAKYTGAPWWVSLAIVLGLVMIIALGVVIVEGRGGSSDDEEGSLRAPATTLKGKVQRLPFPNAMLLIGSCVSSMVVVMATIATTVAGFKQKAAQGFMCLFIPFYTHYFLWTNRKKMGATMRILWGWTIVFIGFMIGMTTTGTLKFLLS